MGRKVPFWGGGVGSPSNTMSPGPKPTSIPSGILIHPAVLATIDMGRKLGALPPLGEAEAGFPSNTMSLGPSPTSLLSGILIHPAMATTDIGRNLVEGLCPFGGGGAGSPSNTCMPSFILIHRTVWPQHTNVTSQTGQRSDSIGRTVLQSVAQKRFTLCYRPLSVLSVCLWRWCIVAKRLDYYYYYYYAVDDAR